MLCRSFEMILECKLPFKQIHITTPHGVVRYWEQLGLENSDEIYVLMCFGYYLSDDTP